MLIALTKLFYHVRSVLMLCLVNPCPDPPDPTASITLETDEADEIGLCSAHLRTLAEIRPDLAEKIQEIPADHDNVRLALLRVAAQTVRRHLSHETRQTRTEV